MLWLCKPTKMVKPTGIDNDLCNYCNKSNYQIWHVNILRDKAQMFDQYTLTPPSVKTFRIKAYLISFLEIYINFSKFQLGRPCQKIIRLDKYDKLYPAVLGQGSTSC